MAVIAGHKRAGASDTPNNIEETRKYIRDFDRIAANTGTALELYKEMLAIYPERVNPAVLWYSARATSRQAESGGPQRPLRPTGTLQLATSLEGLPLKIKRY